MVYLERKRKKKIHTLHRGSGTWVLQQSRGILFSVLRLWTFMSKWDLIRLIYLVNSLGLLIISLIGILVMPVKCDETLSINSSQPCITKDGTDSKFSTVFTQPDLKSVPSLVIQGCEELMLIKTR